MAKTAAKKTASTTATSTSRSRAVPAQKAARKAPTHTERITPRRATNLKIVLAVLVAAAALSGISVFIGMSDTGRIDVASTISQRADALESQGELAESEAVRSVTASKQQEEALPNGGLVGRGNKVTEQQKLEARTPTTPVATTTASTTEETASTTEEISPTETENVEETEEPATEDSAPETATP